MRSALKVSRIKRQGSFDEVDDGSLEAEGGARAKQTVTMQGAGLTFSMDWEGFFEGTRSGAWHVPTSRLCTLDAAPPTR